MFVLAALGHQAVLPAGSFAFQSWALNIHNQEMKSGQSATRSGLLRDRVGGRAQVRIIESE